MKKFLMTTALTLSILASGNNAHAQIRTDFEKEDLTRQHEAMVKFDFQSEKEVITMKVLQRINYNINTNFKYKHDAGNNWQSADVTVKKGGDCEDFAILKFETLKAKGFDPSKMYVVVLDYYPIGELHAVLQVEFEGNKYVLDIPQPKIGKNTNAIIYPAAEYYKDGMVYFGINELNYTRKP